MRRGQAGALVLVILAGLVAARTSAREKTQLGELGVNQLYRVRFTPTAFLIGRDHKLVWRGIGTRGWDEGPTREPIESLLEAP